MRELSNILSVLNKYFVKDSANVSFAKREDLKKIEAYNKAAEIAMPGTHEYFDIAFRIYDNRKRWEVVKCDGCGFESERLVSVGSDYFCPYCARGDI